MVCATTTSDMTCLLKERSGEPYGHQSKFIFNLSVIMSTDLTEQECVSSGTDEGQSAVLVSTFTTSSVASQRL